MNGKAPCFLWPHRTTISPMRRPDIRRLPAGLLGTLFFLILVCTFAAMFLVDRRSESALVRLQRTFTASYEGIQDLRIHGFLCPFASEPVKGGIRGSKPAEGA